MIKVPSTDHIKLTKLMKNPNSIAYKVIQSPLTLSSKHNRLIRSC